MAAPMNGPPLVLLSTTLRRALIPFLGVIALTWTNCFRFLNCFVPIPPHVCVRSSPNSFLSARIKGAEVVSPSSIRDETEKVRPIIHCCEKPFITFFNSPTETLHH